MCSHMAPQGEASLWQPSWLRVAAQGEPAWNLWTGRASMRGCHTLWPRLSLPPCPGPARLLGNHLPLDQLLHTSPPLSAATPSLDQLERWLPSGPATPRWTHLHRGLQWSLMHQPGQQRQGLLGCKWKAGQPLKQMQLRLEQIATQDTTAMEPAPGWRRAKMLEVVGRRCQSQLLMCAKARVSGAGWAARAEQKAPFASCQHGSRQHMLVSASAQQNRTPFHEPFCSQQQLPFEGCFR